MIQIIANYGYESFWMNTEDLPATEFEEYYTTFNGFSRTYVFDNP